ncbi:MAG: TetR/AcrR family transcriptional regulator [Rhodothermales bacterium]|nr:TetR/AcrR family transcriptional regulator [Rhodothermales bacterium]
MESGTLTDSQAGLHPDDDLRTQILDAARHLMVSDGYSSLSMRRIARKIGYSATSIYLHFSGKDDLFYTLIDEGMERLNRYLEEASRVNASADNVLRAICNAFVEFGLTNPEYYEVMFVLHPDTGSRYPAPKYRKARRNIAIIASALEKGIAEERFVIGDVALTANTIWATLHGVVTLIIAQRIDKTLQRNRLVTGTIEIIIAGISNPNLKSS